MREAAAIGEADVGMQLDDGGATSGVRRASESDDAGSCVESGVGESSAVRSDAVGVEMQQIEDNSGNGQLSEKAQGKRRKSKAASKRGEGCGPGGTQAAIARRRAAGGGN